MDQRLIKTPRSIITPKRIVQGMCHLKIDPQQIPTPHTLKHHLQPLIQASKETDKKTRMGQ
jgi:hypothetical protein